MGQPLFVCQRLFSVTFICFSLVWVTLIAPVRWSFDFQIVLNLRLNCFRIGAIVSAFMTWCHLLKHIITSWLNLFGEEKEANICTTSSWCKWPSSDLRIQEWRHYPQSLLYAACRKKNYFENSQKNWVFDQRKKYFGIFISSISRFFSGLKEFWRL